MIRNSAYETARYGHRASQVGEAQHPGPSQDGAEVYTESQRNSVVQVGHAARTAARTRLNLASKQSRAGGTDICPAIQRQKWSDLHRPLIWAAAGCSFSHDVLDWLEAILINHFADERLGTARTGWQALHGSMRSWGVSSEQDLATWMESQGLGSFTARQYIGWEVQEYIFNRAIQDDGHVAALHGAYIRAALQLSRHPGLVEETLTNLDMRREGEAASNAHVEEAREAA